MSDKTTDLNRINWTEKRVAKFWQRVTRGDGCWEWSRCLSSGGYGVVNFREDGKNFQLKAHRVALHLLGIGIPDGKVVDHICRNRRCVRPSHLRFVTVAENLMAEGSLCLAKKKADQERCQRGHEFSVVPSHEANRKPFRRRCMVCFKESQKRRAGK